MDKKKQFQKQLLASKIKENTIILSKLEKSYNDLIDNYNSNSTINTSNTSNTSNSIIISNTKIIGNMNNTVTTNNSVNIDNLNTLQQHKFTLENNKKNIKQNINNLTLTISQLEHNLKVLPLNTKDTLINEIDICNDEHQRIENDRLETINNHFENIKKANLDKEELLKDIELLKVNINLQSNVIYNIQKECHSSRKNILENLKEKKQLKIKLNNTIENATLNKNSFIEQINNLNNSIDNLIEFKKLLVNESYDTDTLSNLTELENYYKLYNIDTSIVLNDKLTIIDTIISNNKTQILLFEKKLSKTEILNSYNIKESINNYNTKDTCKVLTYKDKFKIEKEKKNKLRNDSRY